MSSPPVARWERLTLAGLLAALAAALAWQAWHVGVTADEPSHLISAHLYWKGQDKLLPRDVPPLLKLAGGWPSLFFNLPVPYDHPVWERQMEWEVAGVFFDRLQPPLFTRYIFASRLPVAVFPLLLCALVWWWGRQLYSPRTALLAAGLMAVHPTALGHGALFKNDLMAAAAYLFFWYRAWRFWRAPGWRGAALVAVALLLALLTKMSMLVLLGVAPVLLLARAAAPEWRRAGRGLGWIVLAALIVYAGLAAAVQGDIELYSGAELDTLQKTHRLTAAERAPLWVLGHLPLPAQFVEGGISLFKDNRRGDLVYFMGRKIPGGHPLYFLTAWALKTPPALQLVVLGGLAFWLASLLRGRQIATTLFLLLPALLYAGLASFSSLQLGLRLVLPAAPFLVLMCGAFLEWLGRFRFAWPAFVLAASTAVPTALQFPNTISYLNVWSGGLTNAWRYLGDSNLDWGQGLPELAEYAARHNVGVLNISYFGNDRPHRMFPPGSYRVLPPPWNTAGLNTFRLIPERGYYAISAALLPGHYFAPRFRDYYAEFREHQPVAILGGSILLYRFE